jgi:hypothetical protein
MSLLREGETMKIKFYFIGMFALVTLALAAPRTWTFQTGVKVEGNYVSSGTTTVVVNKSGTYYQTHKL